MILFIYQRSFSLRSGYDIFIHLHRRWSTHFFIFVFCFFVFDFFFTFFKEK